MARLAPRPVALALALAALAALLLSPIPAAAGPTSFDLPRIDFGTMDAPATRACTDASRPGAAACTPAK